MRLNWGTAMAAVYTVFALSTIGFVVFAMEQPVDLVSDDYYDQSLRHDDRMAAERNLQALGARFVLAAGAGGRTLHLILPREQAVSATGTITLYRPSDSTEDQSWPLTLEPDASQDLSLEALAAGRWRVEVAWDAAGASYYYERNLDLR